MQSKKLPDILSRASEGDSAASLLEALASHWPGAPDFVFYSDLAGATRCMADGDPAVAALAAPLSRDRAMSRAWGSWFPWTACS